MNGQTHRNGALDTENRGERAGVRREIGEEIETQASRKINASVIMSYLYTVTDGS